MGQPFDFMPKKGEAFEKAACSACGGRRPVNAPDKRCRWCIPQPARAPDGA